MIDQISIFANKAFDGVEVKDHLIQKFESERHVSRFELMIAMIDQISMILWWRK